MNPRYGDSTRTRWRPARSTRRCATAWPWAPIRDRIAILDNFCWGYTDRPETLGSLVRAALACHDVALAFGTPFISGKDSLNNEFSYVDAEGGNARSPSRRRC